MAMKSGVPGSLRRKVMASHDFTCAICRLSGWPVRFPKGSYGYPTPVEGVYLSIDHIVPRAKGGTSDESNLRVLCTRCNTKKGTRCATHG